MAHIYKLQFYLTRPTRSRNSNAKSVTQNLHFTYRYNELEILSFGMVIAEPQLTTKM